MFNIDITNSKIIITGEINCLRREIISYLNSKFEFVDKTETKYVCEFACEQIEAIGKLKDAFEHYKVKYEFSNNIESKQKMFFEEEKNFEVFSEKAKRIRENHCDVEEFQKFKSILEKNMKNRRLYGLQFLSAYHLAFAQNACNFSVPGAGKTSIVYGAYCYLKSLEDNHPKKVNKILVIGPLNSFGPWEEEYIGCFGICPTTRRIVGMNKGQREEYFQGHLHSELTLVSYATAATSYEDIIAFLKNEKVMVVLDEAHKIKNVSVDAHVAPNILKIAKYARARVVLTGTPVPNGYVDLYNLYQFIWPNRDIIKFTKNQLTRMSKEELLPSKQAMIKRMTENISPFFIRIKKSDFENMPEPIENPMITVEMDEEQCEIYNYIESNCIKMLEEKTDVSTITKARIIRMMQAATNPILLKKPIDDLCSMDITISKSEILNKIKEYNRIPNKFTKCVELTKEILNKVDEKVVIWANFIDNIKLIKKLLDSYGIENEMLYGATPVESDFEEEDVITREKIVKRFNDKKSSLRVLIANPYAASESISLHKVCHNAIYLERNFNAATYIQSKDRIHRYGLRKEDKINYYYLGSQNTIDSVIDERLSFKERRMKELIESEEIPLFSNYFDMEYNTDDIKELLRTYVNRKN